MKLFSMFFVLTSFLVADEWLDKASKNIDPKAIEWAKEHLKKKLTKENIQIAQEKIDFLTKAKCQTYSKETLDPSDNKLFIFMSFSLPDHIWLQYSKSLEKAKGKLVLRGLPENSFKTFIKKIQHLAKKGMTASVCLDPVLFETHHITEVPAFLVKDNDTYDILKGNLSLQSALELLARLGETEEAKRLARFYNE